MASGSKAKPTPLTSGLALKDQGLSNGSVVVFKDLGPQASTCSPILDHHSNVPVPGPAREEAVQAAGNLNLRID